MKSSKAYEVEFYGEYGHNPPENDSYIFVYIATENVSKMHPVAKFLVRSNEKMRISFCLRAKTFKSAFIQSLYEPVEPKGPTSQGSKTKTVPFPI